MRKYVVFTAHDQRDRMEMLHKVTKSFYESF